MRRAILVLVALVTLAACTTGAPSARQRAALLAHKGQEREAAAVLRDYLAQNPDAIAERRLLIRVVALTGDLGSAEREAQALAERLGPNDPTPWIEMGHAFELNHRYDQALSMYDRAAEVSPKNAAGPREGGLRAARWGEAELAAPRLEEALRRDSRDARVWHALGVVRLRLKDVAGARTAYRSGLVADPRSLENHLGLATIAIKQGDAQSALEHYEVIVRERPRLADARLGQSWALIGLGRFDDAEAALLEGEKLGANRRAIAALRRRPDANELATAGRCANSEGKQEGGKPTDSWCAEPAHQVASSRAEKCRVYQVNLDRRKRPPAPGRHCAGIPMQACRVEG